MSVKIDPGGRRSVEVAVELPGSPEEIWRAIATGPGISSWFYPTDVEEREGGAIVFHLGAGGDSPGTVTAWEPPRRFAYEERGWGEGAPPLATELLVEARDGGRCAVRLVHSLFAEGADWDDQLESFEAGWPPFFRMLRLVLLRFPGAPCAPVRASANFEIGEPEAWAAVTGALGFAGVAPGSRGRGAHASAPDCDGVVVHREDRAAPRELLLVLDRPAPGIALLAASTWAGRVHATAALSFFGEQAAAVAAREQPRWQAFLGEAIHFKES